MTIEIRPAAPSYKGSTRNGVTSKSYGSFGGSFVFVGNGEKISTVSPGSSTSGAIPIDIAGSWYGSTDKRGRLNFWQNGDEFMVIMSWPDDAAGVWESYRGEGKLKGRLMEFKVFPSSKEGRSIDQGYVYYLTVSDDNKSITGYYTVNGVKADRGTMHYYRVQ